MKTELLQTKLREVTSLLQECLLWPNKSVFQQFCRMPELKIKTMTTLPQLLNENSRMASSKQQYKQGRI